MDEALEQASTTYFFLEVQRPLKIVVRSSLLICDLDEASEEGVLAFSSVLAEWAAQGDEWCSPGVTVRMVDLMARPNDLIELFLLRTLHAATLAGRCADGLFSLSTDSPNSLLALECSPWLARFNSLVLLESNTSLSTPDVRSA